MTVNMSQREKGQFPISIGTSLAIEGGMGIHPDHPSPAKPLLDCKEVWFNCFTLFRNLMASLKGEDQRAALITELHPALVEDLLGCQSVIEQVSKGKVKAKFYLNDYSPLAKTYPYAKFKTASTDYQLIYQTIEEATLTRLLREPPVEIMRYKLTIQEAHPSALMLTHFPFDLLARYRFERLALLESHTGKVKTPPQWNTKLNIKPEAAAHLPFSIFTLQVCGDGQQFMIPSRTLKDKLVEVSVAGRWSSVTTEEKIKYDLNKFVTDDQQLSEFKRYY